MVSAIRGNFEILLASFLERYLEQTGTKWRRFAIHRPTQCILTEISD